MVFMRMLVVSGWCGPAGESARGAGAPLAEVVGEDLMAAPAELPAVVGPKALPPVAEAARFRGQQVEQRVAVGAAAPVDGPAVQHLVEPGAELVHWSQEALTSPDPTDIVCPRATLHAKAGPLALECLQGLVGGARLPGGDVCEQRPLVDRPAGGQHALGDARLLDQFEVLGDVRGDH